MRYLISIAIILLVTPFTFAQQTIFSDPCDSETGWTLGQSTGTSYIKWRVNNQCGINGGALAINSYSSSTQTWYCEYWWNQSVSSGIVANKVVNATGAHTLQLEFDWICLGEWGSSVVYDYGKVGYSTDGGQTYNWFVSGGKANGLYYNQSTAAHQVIYLPAELNNSSFRIAFFWRNDGSYGTDPAFIVDNIEVKGLTSSPQTISTYPFESDNGEFTHSAQLGTDEWEWGAPQGGQGPSSAHGGTKLWATDLDNTYSSNSEFSLYTPKVKIKETEVRLEFWSWYKIENGYDFGFVQYKINNGSWTTFTNGTFTSNSTTWGLYLYRLTGMTVNDSIQFRWFLDTDGSVVEAGWYIDDVVIQNAGMTPPDNNSTVSAGAGAEPATISSLSDTYEERAMSLDFIFSDAGTEDGLPAIIDTIRITPGNSNTVSNWTNAIAGARLAGPDLGTELTGTASANGILFTGNGFISVADNTAETYELKIWLKTDLSQVNDNDILEFKLSYSDVKTKTTGSSGFGSGTVESGDNNNKIDIAATKLNFKANEPPTSIDKNQPFTVSVFASDANGNTDKDQTSSVTLALASGDGILSSGSGLTKNLVQGSYSWTDVSYNSTGTFTINATAAGLTTATSAAITSANFLSYTFESNDGNFTHSATAGTDSWQWGTPTSGPGSAHGGTKLWATNLSGNYDNNSTLSLHTEELLALSSQVTWKFWHWYDIETTYDYGQLQYSLNGGGWVNVSGGSYDGTSGGWQQVTVNLTVAAGDKLQLRWKLTTDYSVVKPGWYIDDVTISNVRVPLVITSTQTPDSCSGNGIGQVNLSVSGGVSPYTYAWSNGNTTEDLANAAAGDYTVTVTDSDVPAQSEVRSFTIPTLVKWNYLNNIQVSNDADLVKTGTTGKTNSWASSKNTLVGDGQVRFIINNTTDEFILGLSKTRHTEGSYYAIDFAMERDLGYVWISTVEDGFPMYTAFEVGDTFSIRREADTISYWVNNTPASHTNIYSSSLPLYVEASIDNANGLIGNIAVDFCSPLELIVDSITPETDSALGAIAVTASNGTSPYSFNWWGFTGTDSLPQDSISGSVNGSQLTLSNLKSGEYYVKLRDGLGFELTKLVPVGVPLLWANDAGVTLNSNEITKTAADGWGNAKITATNLVEAGDNGVVLFSAGQINKQVAAGLRATANAQANSYQDMNFAFYLDNLEIKIWENGNLYTGFGTYSTSDVFKIELAGTNLYYKKNKTIIRSTTIGANDKFVVDFALNNNGAKITGIHIIGFRPWPKTTMSNINPSSCTNGLDGTITVSVTKPANFSLLTYQWYLNGSYISVYDNLTTVTGLAPGSYKVRVNYTTNYGFTGKVENTATVALTPSNGGTAYLWTGIESTAWNTANNWSPAGIPGTNATDNVIILTPETANNFPSLDQTRTIADFCLISGQVSIPANTLTVDDMIMRGAGFSTSVGAVVNVNGDVSVLAQSAISHSGTINLHGDWLNNSGATVSFGGTVELRGQTGQNISGSASTTFNNLTVNNISANGIIIERSIIINAILSLLDGIVATDEINSITLGSLANTSGASNLSYVNGPITKLLNGPFTFPTGKNSFYKPISVTVSSEQTSPFTAEYYNQGQSLGSNKESSIESISNCEYWKLTHNVNKISKTTLEWSSDNCSVTPVDDKIIVAWDGAKWVNAGNNLTDPNAQSNRIISLSPIYPIAPIQVITIGTKTSYPSVVYTILRKKLDGGYYLAKNKKVYFKYDEEYQDGLLDYKVYDNAKRQLTTGVSINNTGKEYGDNRYELTFASTIPSGYYLLEVISDKNESYFLKFKL